MLLKISTTAVQSQSMGLGAYLMFIVPVSNTGKVQSHILTKKDHVDIYHIDVL